MLVLGIVTTLTGAHKFFSGAGLDLGKLLFFALADGFRGGLHLAVDVEDHRQVEHRSARVIESPANSTEYCGWSRAVRRFSEKAGLPMPEVAIYEGEPNAFATGATRNQLAGRGIHRPAAEA
jgi:heat shock protein HtpX